MKSILSLVQAFLFLVSAFAVEDSNFKEWTDWAALGMTSEKTLQFDAVNADALRVTENEKQRCRDWFEQRVRLIGGDVRQAAFSFAVGGRNVRTHPDDWTVTVGDTAADAGQNGKTYRTVLTHKQSGLAVTVEATIWADYAACEWTLFAHNPGGNASPVFSALRAADCTLPTGKTDLYVSKGSNADADDFRLYQTRVNALPMRLSANGGRTSSFLPYFNLCGQDHGVVLSVGWTGQWLVRLTQKRNGVAIRAQQETLRGFLDPDETIRSPKVALQFYDGNALKGFNCLRKWETDCVQPDSAFGLTTQGMVNEFDRHTCEELVEMVNDMPQSVCDAADYMWMDAGWYTNGGNWYETVGTWIPDPTRFPQGLKPLSDAIHARGLGFLLWYEPERCCVGTQVYREASQHAGWLFPKKNDENVNMFNLANDDACAYLGNLIASSVRDNGVDVYRQDFNFDPLAMWEKADRELYGGRKGFEENHYVTNLYRYLDTLLSENPGLLIDNCASGGRRLDIEMMRRGIPLWRSDYNCMNSERESKPDVLEATQAHTYGLSCWLPLHGTCAYIDGEYADRTNILPCSQRLGYEDVRAFMTQNYYPLLDGGTADDRVLAMQFGTHEAGAALVYKRKDVRETSVTLHLNGLRRDAVYTLWDTDAPDAVFTRTGAQCMDEGVTLSIPDAPKAVILRYEAVS